MAYCLRVILTIGSGLLWLQLCHEVFGESTEPYAVDLADPCRGENPSGTAARQARPLSTPPSTVPMETRVRINLAILHAATSLLREVIMRERLSNLADLQYLRNHPWPSLGTLNETLEIPLSGLPENVTYYLQKMDWGLMRAAVIIHHVHLNELVWAGIHPGGRQRETTYEDDVMYIEIKLSHVMCSLRNYMHHHQVAPDADLMIDAISVEHQRPNTSFQGDTHAVRVLNTFEDDIIFLDTFLENVLRNQDEE